MVGDPTINAPGFDSLPWDGYADLSGGTPGSKNVYDAGNDPNHIYFLEEHHWESSSIANPNKVPVSKTERNWSAAVLQRLADPLLPFDEVLNPYITVDWHSIDLTVFSGEDNAAQTADTYFATRQKSGAHTRYGLPNPSAASAQRRMGNLGETFFTYDTTFPNGATSDVTTTTNPAPYFKQELLTEYYANQSTPPLVRGSGVAFTTLGYLNQDYVLRGYPNTNEYKHPYFVGGPSRVPDAIDLP